MAEKLHIGETVDSGEPFALPREAALWTLAILAKKGAGKSWTAGVLMEEFSKAGVPFVCLDPVGIHWGLRSSADGRRESPYAPVVFGGEHGDIEIERHMGAVVARAIAEERASAVVDLTELSKTAWREFVRDLCLELYVDARRRREPRHVIIEEATEFVPQTRRPELQEAYEAVERLVRLGRNYGLGCTLVSQRSAQVAKDVLTQLDLLIALRTVGPQDRQALEDMFSTVLEADQLSQLAAFRAGVVRLEDGVAWVWSPEKLKAFVKVKVRARETYHAGAAPGLERVQVVQARPDVSRMRAMLAEAGAPAGRAAVGAGAGEKRASRERVASLEEECARLRAEAEKLEVNRGRLAEELRVTREDLEREAARSAAAGALREAFVAFLNGTVAMVGAAVDEEAIVRRVTERVGVGGAVVQVAAPEALRTKYLERAAARMYERAAALGPDPRAAFEFLAGQGKFVALNTVAVALSGNDAGATRERWRRALVELERAGVVRKGGTGRAWFSSNVEAGVRAELAVHSPTDDEVQAVVAQVLHRVAVGTG